MYLRGNARGARHVDGLEAAIGARLHLELHGLALTQTAEALAADVAL